MKKKTLILKKRLKKTRRNNFRGKFFLRANLQKADTLLDILKSTLKKKKKRRARLAGRNFYMLSMRKVLNFQRHYSFFRLRYVAQPSKYKIHKNFYIFVVRRKYRNTILERGFIKRIARLHFFMRTISRGRKTQLIYKLRKSKRPKKRFSLIRKLILTFRFLIIK